MDEAARFEQAKQRFVDGLAHYRAGRMAEAEAGFAASLALLPGRSSTIVNLAAARNGLGRHDAALALLDELLAREPQDREAWVQRAAALAGLQRREEALASLDRAVALQPDDPAALQQRGLMLTALHRPQQALVDFSRLVALRPEDAEAWLRQGQTLQRLGRLDEALASYDRALALAPGEPSLWTQRGTLLRERGRSDEAASAFRQALAAGGDAALNGYYLAALAGGPAPDRAPDHYVQALFDDYAQDFEQHLVDRLGYRAHTALAEQLERLAPGRRFDSALDLGCGSGLCGPLLRPRAARLEGVDLSAQMVARARGTGVYDLVRQADAAQHLAEAAARGERHDLVLAADVFIYVGRLEAVFAGVQRVLVPGGLFCFSVERADDAEDLRLTPGLRYAHSARYLRALAESNGLAVREISAQPIRREQGQEIAGLLVCLQAA